MPSSWVLDTQYSVLITGTIADMNSANVYNQKGTKHAQVIILKGLTLNLKGFK